ncbi:hypothetical protein NKI82_33100 [Mesorhizobium sp. M0482]|uniref:hypothetical protein n=1 Tax=Mesorhizobium sp. M0482 TaxID=2956948 RepID=UPI00333C96C0
MMKHFVGLDVSLDLTSVCVLDEEGAVVWRGKGCLNTLYEEGQDGTGVSEQHFSLSSLFCESMV